MSKIYINENIYEGRKIYHTQYFYWCEGCGYEHCFALKADGGHHNWNGDINNPTIEPSLVKNYLKTSGTMCHSFIRDGKIQYLNDCTHILKGQTIELPDYKIKKDEATKRNIEKYNKEKGI